MSATTVTQRIQTTSTVTSTASVLLINTGYLKSKEGILKSTIAVLSLVLLVLVFCKGGRSNGWFSFTNGDLFLLLVTFCHFYITTIMLFACLFSLTSSLLSKLSFDFIYHIMGGVLYLTAFIWATVNLGSGQTLATACVVIVLIICLLHFVHGILSYRVCRNR